MSLSTLTLNAILHQFQKFKVYQNHQWWQWIVFFFIISSVLSLFWLIYSAISRSSSINHKINDIFNIKLTASNIKEYSKYKKAITLNLSILSSVIKLINLDNQYHHAKMCKLCYMIINLSNLILCSNVVQWLVSRQNIQLHHIILWHQIVILIIIKYSYEMKFIFVSQIRSSPK